MNSKNLLNGVGHIFVFSIGRFSSLAFAAGRTSTPLHLHAFPLFCLKLLTPNTKTWLIQNSVDGWVDLDPFRYSFILYSFLNFLRPPFVPYDCNRNMATKSLVRLQLASRELIDRPSVTRAVLDWTVYCIGFYTFSYDTISPSLQPNRRYQASRVPAFWFQSSFLAPRPRDWNPTVTADGNKPIVQAWYWPGSVGSELTFQSWHFCRCIGGMRGITCLVSETSLLERCCRVKGTIWCQCPVSNCVSSGSYGGNPLPWSDASGEFCKPGRLREMYGTPSMIKKSKSVFMNLFMTLLFHKMCWKFLAICYSIHCKLALTMTISQALPSLSLSYREHLSCSLNPSVPCVRNAWTNCQRLLEAKLASPRSGNIEIVGKILPWKYEPCATLAPFSRTCYHPIKCFYIILYPYLYIYIYYIYPYLYTYIYIYIYR